MLSNKYLEFLQMEEKTSCDNIATLQELCIQVLFESVKHAKLEYIIKLFVELDLENYHIEKLRSRLKLKLFDYFPYMLENYGAENIQDLFSPEEWANLNSSYQNSLEIKRRFSELKGNIIEKPLPTLANGQLLNLDKDLEYYPFECLRQGVVWPKNVDPKKRETYLHPDEFATVFGMSYDEYTAIPLFKRERLKKEKGLF